MTDNNVQIKEYQCGDEEKILALMWDVFGVKRSIGYWNWQFNKINRGKSWINLAEANGNIVGNYSTMSCDLNYKGTRIRAGQSCDLMVHSNQRGKGLFTRLAHGNFEAGRRDGIKAVIGFPNRNSYPNFVRNLGWVRNATLKYYFMRTSLNNLLGPVDIIFRGLILSACSVKYLISKLYLRSSISIITSSVPLEGLDTVLHKANQYEILSVWKDIPYLIWRYVEHPVNKYQFHTMQVNGEVAAFAVTRDSGESITICELVHGEKDVVETSLLLRYIANKTIVSKRKKLVFYGYDSGFFDASFSMAGFECWSTSPFVLCGQVFDDAPLDLEFRQPQNWSITIGDTDVI